MPHGGPNRKVCKCGNLAYKSGYCASCQLVLNAERQRIARLFKQEMLDRQNGLCAWPPCGKPVDLSLYIRAHATDHDHRIWPKSNWIDHKYSVRGIVHPSCNMKIGYVEELRRDGHVVVSDEIAVYLDLIYKRTTEYGQMAADTETSPDP